MHIHLFKSQDKLVDIGTGWMAGVQFPAGAKDVSLFHSVQTGSGALPASYSMDIRVYFLGDKAAGAYS
jgi:hypothetical protein